MTKPVLLYWPPSAAHVDNVRAAGFDIDDPDRRHPVQVPWRDKVRARTATAPLRDPRAQDLLQARNGPGQVLSRGLCLAGVSLGALLAGGPAEARRGPVQGDLIHPPTPLEDAIIDPGGGVQATPLAWGEVHSVEPWLSLPWLSLPGLDDPIWAAVLIALLAITSLASLGLQIWQIFQATERSADMPAQRAKPEDDIRIEMAHDLKISAPESVQEKEECLATGLDLDTDLDALGEAGLASDTNTESEPEPEALPEPVPSGFIWRVDGSSRMGQVREENQDAFVILEIEADRSVLILCDGAGGVKGGREAAICAVAAISKRLTSLIDEGNTSLSERDLEGAIAAAQAQATALDLSGVTTAIIASLDRDRLTFATLGDGNLTLIWPDGMVTQALAPHHQAGRPSNIITAYIGDGCDSPPRTGSLRVEPGTTVMAMSDGAGDLFAFDAFGLNHDTLVNTWRHVGNGFADSLVAQIEAWRDDETGAYLHSDNMTIAMAHLEAREVDHA